MVTESRNVLRFADKVIIVTGARGGIGRAISERFADEGCHLVLADIVESAAQELFPSTEFAREVCCSGSAMAADCDVSDEMQVETVVSRTLEHFGRIDVIVNAAGVMIHKPLEKLSAQDWRRTIDVNLMGAVYFTQQALRHMKPGGAIVNIASIHAVRTTPLAAAYAASKAALISLTRSTAIEANERGIRANAVLPGAIDTPMLWENPNIKSGAEAISAKDIGSPNDIAAITAFLASEDACFINGGAFIADGGRMAAL